MNKRIKVVFSDRAYNSIVSETFDKIKTETGGILLGKIIDDVWYIVEVIDPGPNSIFTITYFEYDTAYVNHLAKVISKQYKIELALLGLWHRHPGSMDTFSSTDDLTNNEFLQILPNGAISCLVNIDPNFRITVYYVSFPLQYTKLTFEVGDILFPPNLLNYKYSFSKKGNYIENPKSPIETIQQNRGKNLQKNIIDRFFDSFLRKHQITIVNNNYLTNTKDIPKTKKLDEDYLVDLYVYEEFQMESKLNVRYKSEVNGGKIYYLVYEFANGNQIEKPIKFNVNLDVRNPIFFCADKEFKFSEGVFHRYVSSKINNNEFLG